MEAVDQVDVWYAKSDVSKIFDQIMWPFNLPGCSPHEPGEVLDSKVRSVSLGQSVWGGQPVSKRVAFREAPIPLPTSLKDL